MLHVDSVSMLLVCSDLAVSLK